VPEDTTLETALETEPCTECTEQGDKLDAILTAVVTLNTNVADLATKLENVVGGVNIVGEQNNWIVENAGRVFTAFEEMRAQFAKGGLMGMVKGMKTDG